MLASTAVQSIYRPFAAFADRPNLRAQTAARAARDIELTYIADGDTLAFIAFRARQPLRAHLAAALGAAAVAARQ